MEFVINLALWPLNPSGVNGREIGCTAQLANLVLFVGSALEDNFLLVDIDNALQIKNFRFCTF